jgi:hypothetical protein
MFARTAQTAEGDPRSRSSRDRVNAVTAFASRLLVSRTAAAATHGWQKESSAESAGVLLRRQVRWTNGPDGLRPVLPSGWANYGAEQPVFRFDRVPHQIIAVPSVCRSGIPSRRRWRPIGCRPSNKAMVRLKVVELAPKEPESARHPARRID